MGNGISDIDKLLICLAIIIVLTIIWTILVGITYKMYQTKYFYEKLKKYNNGDDFDDDTYDEEYLEDNFDEDENDEDDEDDEDDEEEIVYKQILYDNNENELKGYYDDDYVDKEEINNIIKEEKKSKGKTEKEKETYVKIKFDDSNKIHIYVAPFRKKLHIGEKIKVRVGEDIVKNAVVVKENYTREKYKNKEYDELEIFQE